ncbi:unnamed protein product [Hydatigera taeniaeformis]|uniref:Ig-like domain-containing protein n=1 Tax=Hydatigena taeniaeformis TaxID=6205 RepID=A0A0R3WR62_HYDTA|nr:unnamed protein product [Hydatigera taeniaeformis]
MRSSIVTYFLLLIVSIGGATQPLQLCKVKITMAAGSSSYATSSSGLASCTTQRQEEAALQHHLMLQRPDYNQKVSLKCPLCPGESTSSFVWYFLPRSTSATFTSINGRVSLIKPGGTPLSQDRFSGKAIPCLINGTNELFIPSFNHDVHVGTYYCRNVEDSHHLANSIWYHLDVILPPDTEGLSKEIQSIPVSLQGVHKLPHLKDVNSIMENAGVALKAAKDFQDFSTPLMSITSRLIPTAKPAQTCGTFNLKRFRRCYITIPRVITSDARHSASAEMLLTYKLLRSTFSSFYTWMDEEDPVTRKKQREAAETRASELGFELFYEGKKEVVRNAEERREEMTMIIEEDFSSMMKEENKHYYIPCHLTYLKHVNLTNELPRPFGTKNLYMNVSFEVSCPEIDYMEIVNLVLATKDTQYMKREVLGYEEKRFMKLQKVAIEGSINFDMLCGTEGDTINYNCSDHKNLTILWKQPRGVTYMPRTFLNERIFVTSDCSLRFEQVRRTDEGVYSCYRRDLRLTDQWQSTAFVSYRLKIEESSIKFPGAGDMCLGFLLLSIWAALLIFVWMILSIWSLDINRTAIVQAGERMRRRDRAIREGVKYRQSCHYFLHFVCFLTCERAVEWVKKLMTFKVSKQQSSTLSAPQGYHC